MSAVTLPRSELLQGSHAPERLAELIDHAEEALRTWQPVWSSFVTPLLREEAAARLGSLSELTLHVEGGHPGAERCRLQLTRAELDAPPPGTSQATDTALPLIGLTLSGNFLFDSASAGDFRRGLLQAGAQEAELGDLWLRGDRGAQLVVTPELAGRFAGGTALVRSVEVQLETTPLERLQPPARPQPRRFSTVEASLRLDAVGSAGFGIPRSRMAEQIRNGAVRVNWDDVRSPSRELRAGDRVRLENRGELTVLEVELTKRDRWRLALLRS
ncbi:MAG: photosystem II S4 domain protein [Cyanobium sp.]|uniref:photosystem II S4 domain protein n=1 Tax=Synechococcus sp. CS-1333 TaxID=2848638 RepID=UPI000DBBD563|nr:photosystem II S4 domain protein [Synechococcus sp. CS-1333]MCT0210514.1 photosystem II S4 domain protein [Synechococcus sp. CS-1333]PZV24058.1 MAG: photosystem II S4 domain protein [Cyanobium sp.]